MPTKAPHTQRETKLNPAGPATWVPKLSHGTRANYEPNAELDPTKLTRKNRHELLSEEYLCRRLDATWFTKTNEPNDNKEKVCQRQSMTTDELESMAK